MMLPIRILSRVSIILFLNGWLWAAPPQEIIIKLGSLAPTGTAWHRVLEDLDTEWRKITNDQVRVRIYPGGVLGDESDVVVKMRLGQIQGAGLTAKGLSDIDKGIWGLSLPLQVHSDEQLHWLHAQVEDELVQRYREAGFVILTWTHLGWIHWFSDRPIRTPADLKQTRMFSWAGQAEMEALWKQEGYQVISLSLLDVLAALETGMINSIAQIPMSVAAYQWFGIVNYTSDLLWSNLPGAMVITVEAWERIPEEYRAPMLAAARRLGGNLQNEVKQLEAEALKVMQEYGLQIIEITPEEFKQWEEIVSQMRIKLRGTLVDTVMYDRVVDLLDQMPPELIRVP